MTETNKCRHRIIKYCTGNGLDLGPNDDKLMPNCIGIDANPKASGANLIGDVRYLNWFRDSVFDFVYSSHTLEDIENIEQVLREWIRVIKPGGYLILYLPHKDYYPNIGHKLANKGHKHDFLPEDIKEVLRKISKTEEVYCKVYGCKEYNHDKRAVIEYSFEIVERKI